MGESVNGCMGSFGLRLFACSCNSSNFDHSLAIQRMFVYRDGNEGERRVMRGVLLGDGGVCHMLCS